jgi:response regulator of citrate/malate metabolism
MKIESQIKLEDDVHRMRLDLTQHEYLFLIKAINESNLLEILENKYDFLIEKLQSFKLIERGDKGIAAIKAREALQEQTKKKVENAINLLRMEQKEITPYAVAKTANISYNTAKKYLKQFNTLK